MLRRYQFLQRLVLDGMRFPPEETFLLPSEIERLRAAHLREIVRKKFPDERGEFRLRVRGGSRRDELSGRWI